MPFLITIITIFIVIIIFIIIKKISSKNNVKKLMLTIFDHFLETKGAFDFKGFKDDKTYLIKVIYNFKEGEININSKNYFQINYGAVNSRKSGKKIENVYDLINLKDENNVIKVYLIYPNAFQILKVLNECEMKIINGNDFIYGCRFITYNELISKKINL